MKNGTVKNAFKRNLKVALTVAPTLAVMIISAVYNVSAGSIDGQLTAPEPILLAVITLFAVTASAALAVLYDLKPTLAVLTAIFLVCFIFYLSAFLRGENALAGDTVFENTAFVLAIPAWSVMPVIYAVAGKLGMVSVLFAVFVLFSVNAGLLIYLCVKDDRVKKCRKN